MKTTYSKLNEGLVCDPDHIVTDGDLRELRKLLDLVWQKLNIDIRFSSHFLDRVNDARNGKQITLCELARLFMETFKQYGPKISHVTKDNWEAVLADVKTDVNVPFVLKHDGKKLDLVSKTVMRKKGFFTPDPKLQVAHFTREKKMKTYRDLKEWIGMNFPDNSPIGSSQIAVDDVDNAAFDVNSENIDKLNGYLSTLTDKQYLNPYYPLNWIYTKLSTVGFSFEVTSIRFLGNEGKVVAPLTRFGGRYGTLGGSQYISSDDGISNEIGGSLCLAIYYQKNGGAYTLTAQIEYNSNLDESVLNELQKPNIDASDKMHSGIHQLMTNHGYKHDKENGCGYPPGEDGYHYYQHPNDGSSIDIYLNGSFKHWNKDESLRAQGSRHDLVKHLS